MKNIAGSDSLSESPDSAATRDSGGEGVRTAAAHAQGETSVSTDPPRIIESTLIPHTAFAKSITRMRSCFERANGKGDPHCVLILGESGTGKSTVQQAFYAEHPAKRLDDGLYMPILRVTVPPNPTVKSFVTDMLIACEDPLYGKGTENDKTARLKVLMRKSGTRMIHVDEANHFFDKGRHALAYHVADWFKVLIDDMKVSVIAAGIPIAAAMLEQNEQLARRFLAPIVMPRFSWNNPRLRDEFIAILEAFHEALAGHFDLPQLHSSEMAFRCYTGTGGLVGILSKFLSLAEEDARTQGRRVITLAHLEEALQSAVWRRDGLESVANPFSKGFVPVPTEDLLAKIEKLGTPKQIVARPRKSRSRAMQPATLKDVFS